MSSRWMSNSSGLFKHCGGVQPGAHGRQVMVGTSDINLKGDCCGSSSDLVVNIPRMTPVIHRVSKSTNKMKRG